MQKPRILFFDVETAPVLAWIWRSGYKINVSHDQIKKGQKFDIICICYKWSDESKIHSLDWGVNKQDSTKMIEEFSKVIEQADIVVAHNADRFDIKQINTQRLIKSMSPLDWPSSNDTLKQFRKYFALPSYKLDYIASLLLKTGKDRMVFQDWIDIVEGKSPKAMEKMIKYCIKDVKMLSDIYKRAAKWFKPKLHVGVMNGLRARSSCPDCGSQESSSKGRRFTATRVYQRRLCLKCGRQYQGELL